MNAKYKHVEDGDAFEYKVTLDITNPEMCVVADELGGNSLQKDNGGIGSEMCFFFHMKLSPSAKSRLNANTTLPLVLLCWTVVH